MKLKLSAIIIPLAILYACNPSKKISTTASEEEKKGNIIPEPKIYHASRTMKHELIHTRLEVRFDWKKKHCYGNATLTLRPYFYATDSLHLDARGFEIKEVSMVRTGNRYPLPYSYSDDVIRISLTEKISAKDTFTVFVDYIAKPDELKEGGSAAITSDKGLYFINADGKEKNKPKQIWTQGETQASSAWFPTIDAPNQRMTQEIFITVDTNFNTLSNGLLISSKNIGKGMKTDHWKQMVPAAPYLTMMAIGEYAVVKDQWRNKEVSYYVEPKFEKEARTIFKNAPEIIDYYSKMLGVDYPWEKMSHVVVRDYVSGAMENASAIVYGEFMQGTARELIDMDSYEDVVSHETIHQWFGNLVTTESWSNIPLNESFATYGEYLWTEYKYGREEADITGQNDLNAYLQESKRKQVNMIRYDYEEQEEVFDVHSYQKGGRILHMLRKYVGDTAFFASLKLYLTKNAFKPVEIHHLRLAFEEVTGEDLNWFFNQWFFASGHPVLTINYEYSDSLKQQKIIVDQVQDFSKTPLYKLPVDLDLYVSGKTTRHRIWIEKAHEEFSFDVSARPDLVNFDAEKMLLAVKNEMKSEQDWVNQYLRGPLYMDRYEAIQKLAKDLKPATSSSKMMMRILGDKNWNIRNQAMKNVKPLMEDDKNNVKIILQNLARGDSKPAVRSAAITALSKNFNDEDLMILYRNAAHDSSYRVVRAALEVIAEKYPDEALGIAEKLEQDDNETALGIASAIYGEHGSEHHTGFFVRNVKKTAGDSKYTLIHDFAQLLTRCSPEVTEKCVEVIKEEGLFAQPWWIRLSAMQALTELNKNTEKKITEAEKEIAAMKKENSSAISGQAKEAETARLKSLKEKITAAIDFIKTKETDNNLIKFYGKGEVTSE